VSADHDEALCGRTMRPLLVNRLMVLAYDSWSLQDRITPPMLTRRGLII